MRMLFLGGTFPKELESEILTKSRGTVFYPANKLQWNLIDGFINNSDIKLSVLSAPFIGTYPEHYQDLFFKQNSIPYKDSIQCEYVSFCNLWGYRNISRKNSLIRSLRRLNWGESENKVIFVYSPHTPFLQAAVYAKKQDPSIHICLIVPDLPQFMNLNEKQSNVYKILKSFDIRTFEKNAKYIDSFVLLTEQMKDILKVGNRPYTIIEGIVSTSDIKDMNSELSDEDIKTIVYTGTLNKKFGVVNLVKAFNALDDEKVRLIICGRGDSENIISEMAKKNNKIQFLGQVSNDVAVNMQQGATVLVNPRQNNEEFTKYSFPSKNMEYLLSGKPVVAYKLDGIPSEYDDYFYYVEENTINSLAKKINEVINLSREVRESFGRRAREFVIEQKSNIKASKKIIEMIKNR